MYLLGYLSNNNPFRKYKIPQAEKLKKITTLDVTQNTPKVVVESVIMRVIFDIYIRTVSS